jgi:DHA2 family multidrug resistance protein
MLAVGIGALQIVLDKGQEADWLSSNFIVTLGLVSLAALVALVFHELTTENPVVDLRIFKMRTYAVGVMLMTVVGFILYGSLVLVPIMLQTLFAYPALQAGIAVAPRGLGSFFMMPITGVMTGRFDSRKLLTAGLVVDGLALVWLSHLNLQAGYWNVFWPQLMQGIGLSLLFVPLTTVSMDPIPLERMGNATSLFNVMRNIGGSVGIATTSTVLARHEQLVTAALTTHVNVYDPTTQSMIAQLRAAFVAAGADVATATDRAHAALFGMIERQAAMISFVHLFRVLGFVFIMVIPLVLLMKRPTHGGRAAAH